MLRKYAAAQVDRHAPENPEDKAEILRLTKHLAANAVFYCVQGQITVFLISFFGRQATSVAEVGALGRLAMIFTVISNLLTNVFVPAFARCGRRDRFRAGRQYLVHQLEIKACSELQEGCARSLQLELAGEYLLMATLVHVDMMPPATRGAGLSGTLRSVLPVYSGDTMRKSEAVSFKLGPGEDRAGMDIAIPLSKLHSVSGVVTAASNGHAINSGEITIEDPIDKDSIANGQLDSDGAFHLDGVPEGSYTLRVQNASDKSTAR